MSQNRNDVTIASSPFVEVNNIPETTFPNIGISQRQDCMELDEENLPVSEIMDPVNMVSLYYKIKKGISVRADVELS